MSDRIGRQVRTFLYSDTQKELAGKDGVEEYTHIYEQLAQFVVVLYRDGYGGTKWTRVEETAIKSAMLEFGAHTILLISLDGKKPKWLPSSRLYYGIELPENAGEAETTQIGSNADLYASLAAAVKRELSEAAPLVISQTELAYGWEVDGQTLFRATVDNVIRDADRATDEMQLRYALARVPDARISLMPRDDATRQLRDSGIHLVMTGTTSPSRRKAKARRVVTPGSHQSAIKRRGTR